MTVKTSSSRTGSPRDSTGGSIQSDIPLHVQVSEMLIREIRSGLLAADERLPPERDMAARLSISVGTLRKALSDLESRGMLARRQGSGNYVQNPKQSDNIYALFRLELLSGGGQPSAEVLSVSTLKKPHSLPDFGTAAHAHRVRRLRKLDGQGVAFEEIWLDGDYAEAIDKALLSESMYQYYKNHLGFWITRVEDRVGVAALPRWAHAEQLETQRVQFGFVERWSRDNSGLTAEYSRTWFNPDTTRFVAR